MICPTKLPRDFFDDAAPFKIEGVYCKLIPLTKGQFAIVDAGDYNSVSRSNWSASWNRRARTHYAHSHRRDDVGAFRTIVMHRIVLGLGPGDRRQGDHINSCGLDNRRKNLRIACQAQNSQNMRLHVNSSTGLKGVTKIKSGFVAHLRGKHLGIRKTAVEAHELYCVAAQREFGEFARTR